MLGTSATELQTTAESDVSSAYVHSLIPNSLEWRCIGPFRGGRAVAVAGDTTNHWC